MGRARRRWGPSLFALLGLGLIALAAARLPVDYDEAYYFTWSRRWALSYFDHPPLIAWVLRLSTALLGTGRLGLRIGPLLGTLIVGLATVGSVRRLCPEAPESATQLALLGLGGSLMLTVGYLPATPDPLQGALLALAGYALVRSRAPRWAFLAGVLLPLAILAKHSSALVGLGALLGLARSPEGRQRLGSGPMLAGLGLGGALLLPWLWADLSGGGATHFQAARVLEAHTPRPFSALPLLLGATALTFGPGVALAQWAQLAVELRRPRSLETGALAGGAALLLLGCWGAAALGAGELNWPLPALVFGLPAVVAWLQAGPPGARRWYRGSSLAAVAFGGLVLLHVIAPFLPIRADQDRTLRAAGFQQVAQEAAALAACYQAPRLIARRYQAASMLRYHGQDRYPVLELSTGRQSQYDRWPRPRICLGERAILVLNHPGLSEETQGHFEPIASSTIVQRQRAGRLIDEWWLTPVRALDDSVCGSAP